MPARKNPKISLSLEDVKEIPFLVAGLISPHSPYLLARWLNHELLVDFTRSSDLIVEKIGKTPIKSFVRYRFLCQLHRFKLMLLANQQDKTFFSPEHKNINYWLVIQCEEEDETDLMMREIINLINQKSPSDCFAVAYSSQKVNHYGYFEQE